MSWLRGAIQHWSFVPLAIAASLGLWLAADGRLHWDEPGYLYEAAYQDFDEIIAGAVQSSGLPDFIQGRILHVLFLKGFLTLTGPGELGFWIIILTHLFLIAATLLLINRILRELLPEVLERPAALAVLAMTPVVLYLAFKTMADTESLAAATLVTLALLRCGQGRSTFAWGIAAAVGLALVALTKNQMAFMPAGFWASTCLIQVGQTDRRRLAWAGALAGSAGVILSIVLLEILGIGVERYLGSYSDVLARSPPFAAQLMNAATLFGIFWLLLPVAFASGRRRQLGFLVLWALLSVTPLLAIASAFEARHLAVTLIAAGGLFALALEVIAIRFRWWMGRTRIQKSVIATLAVLIAMTSNALVIAVMPHEVEIRQLRALFVEVDRRFGEGGYVVLTPWAYTDFQVIRVLWPAIDVRDVGSSWMSVRTDLSTREQALDAWHDGRNIESPAGLAELDRPLVYIGFRHTFSVENLRAMLEFTAGKTFADGLLGNLDLVDHFAKSWLWKHPDYEFREIARSGHYRAFEVTRHTAVSDFQNNGTDFGRP
ncbi:MAG: hypothetical protein ACREVI_04515 [Steroidobacteraceae bacterium]